MKKFINIALLAIAFTLVSACGGGGGGGSASTVTSTETFQIKSAWVNYLTSTSTLNGTVTGTISATPTTGTFIVTQGNIISGTFEGQSVLSKASTVTGNLVVGGTSIPSAVTVTSYFDSNYNPLGKSGGTDYEVVAGSVSIPNTAKVGDTAILYTLNRYSSSSKAVLRGTTQISYVIEPDTATTANLKFIEIERDTSNTTTSNSVVSLILTPSGGITFKQETLTESGTALTVTY